MLISGMPKVDQSHQLVKYFITEIKKTKTNKQTTKYYTDDFNSWTFQFM